MVVQPLAGNLRAYFAQLNFAALHDAQNRLRFDVVYGLQSPKPRVEGQAVRGDAIVFKSTADYAGVFVYPQRGCSGRDPSDLSLGQRKTQRAETGRDRGAWW